MENNIVLLKADKEQILNDVKNYTTNQEVIDIVKKDLDLGLSEVDVAVYYKRKGVGIMQMQLLSDLLKVPGGRDIIKVCDENGNDYSRLSLAYDFLTKGIPVEDVIKTYTQSKNACELKKLYEAIFAKIQEFILAEPTQGENIDKDYVTAVVEEIKEEIKKINFLQNQYNALDQKLNEIAVNKEDEMIRKNLVNQNSDQQKEIERLKKENDELTVQVEEQQNSLNDANAAIAKQRNSVDDRTREMDSMNVKIKELEAKLATKEEVIENLKDVQSILTHAKSNSKNVEKNNNVPSCEESNDSLSSDIVEVHHDNQQQLVSNDINNDKMQSEVEKKEVQPVMYAVNQALPVYYTLAVIDGDKIIQNIPLEIMEKKSLAIITNLVSKLSFKKKSRANLVRLVTKGKLDAQQIQQITYGIKNGLKEDQLETLINENVSHEKMKSIIEMALTLNNNVKDGE